MAHGIFCLAASSKHQCNGNELAKRNNAQCNHNSGKIHGGICKDHKVGYLLCTEDQSVAINGGLQKFYHSGSGVVVSHLQARTSYKSLRNDHGERKGIILGRLHVAKVEVIRADRVERAEQFCCFFNCDEAVCCNLACSNCIRHSTTQSLDILNGVKANAAILAQTKQAFQLHCTASSIEIIYRDGFHISYCCVVGIIDRRLSFILCGNFTNCFSAKYVKLRYISFAERTGIQAIHQESLQGGNLSILISCKGNLCLYFGNPFFNLLIEIIGEWVALAQRFNFSNSFINERLGNTTIAFFEHPVQICNGFIHIRIVLGKFVFYSRNTAVCYIFDFFQTNKHIVDGTGI